MKVFANINRNDQKNQNVYEMKKSKNIFLKFTVIILMMLFTVAVSVGTALIVHNGAGDEAPLIHDRDGLSAYELAVQNGFDGTLTDWLASLSGKSAYEIAVENGYEGTEKEWAAELLAITSQNITSIKSASFSKEGHFLITLSDGTVLNLGTAVGADGKDGVDGINGADGVGIADVTISDEGVLSVTLTNDTVLNLGNIKGTDGTGISKSEVNANGELVLT